MREKERKKERDFFIVRAAARKIFNKGLFVLLVVRKERPLHS